MQHHETADIKRRLDGSIDIAHYTNIGLQRRSERAHDMAKDVLLKQNFFSLRVWSLGAFRTR